MCSNEKINFSIVVCAYNEEKYLNECLKTLINQDYNKQAYEIIIINNQSKDKTAEIALNYVLKTTSNYPLIKYFEIEHVGLSISRNFAIKQCKGEIIIFIDGDAIVDKMLIKEYDKIFKNKRCGFAGGRIDLLNNKSSVARVMQNTKYKQIFEGTRKKNLLHGANMAFRANIFDKYQFVENFYSRGDDSSFVNIISNEFEQFSSPKSIVYHERPESVTEILKVTWIEMKLAYKVQTLIQQVIGKKKFNFEIAFLNNFLILIFFLMGFFNGIFFAASSLLLLRFKRASFHKITSLGDLVFIFCNLIITIFTLPFFYIYSFFKYKNEKMIKNSLVNTLESINNKSA
jgi:glycosyltransferase involved in cell wall biosynthesis